MSVADEIGDDCVAVVAAGGHDLAAHADGDGVATFFVLFHGVPN